MSRVSRVVHADGSHYGYSFDCPGCKDTHVIPIKPHPNGWDFSGTEEWPTFAPSILVYDHDILLADGTVGRTFRCHSFVRGGRIEFLSDSTHPLAGQTVDLPEVSP